MVIVNTQLMSSLLVHITTPFNGSKLRIMIHVFTDEKCGQLSLYTYIPSCTNCWLKSVFASISHMNLADTCTLYITN